VQSRGRPVIRASADHFHNPREFRYRRGRSSPEGYYRDTYNYPELYKKLLAPLGYGGSGIFQRAAFDVGADKVLFAAEELALPNSILIFDGMFLHRPELRAVWDFSLFLTVPFFCLRSTRCESRRRLGIARSRGRVEPSICRRTEALSE
jgi:uridine kinase